MHTSSPGVVTKTTLETSERCHCSVSPSVWFFSSSLGDFRFQSTLILQPLGSSCSYSSPTLSLEGETEKDLAGGEEDLAGVAGITAKRAARGVGTEG